MKPCCAAISFLMLARSAAAEVVVLPAQGAKIELAEQRLVISTGDKTTAWHALRFAGRAARAGLIVSVPAGGEADLATDAWFDALERSTAPRVVSPPDASASCSGESFFLVHDTSRPWGGLIVAPKLVTHDLSYQVVRELALSRSLDASDARLAALSRAPEGQSYSLFYYEGLESGAAVGVRYSAIGSSSIIDDVGTGSALRTTLFAIAEESVELDGRPEVLSSALGSLWYAAHEQSDYLYRRTMLLESEPEHAIVETSGPSSLRDWTLLPFAARAVPPVSLGCGTTATDGAEADATPQSTSTSSHCVDLERALSGLGGDAVLTRLVTTVRPSERCTLVASNRDLVYPGVVARGVDRSACGSNGSGAAGSGGTAGDAQQGSGGAWAYGCACYCGDLECYRASQNVCAWHNCWHSPPPSDPSRERADESGCSSETVVVYADDGCASDTSSSYEDDGCASDTSSSYEDDGCSGDTVDDSDSACSFAKRPRMSTCTYGFALILLAARRWRRKREKWA